MSPSRCVVAILFATLPAQAQSVVHRFAGEPGGPPGRPNTVSQVANIGDVNGDRRADIAVTTPGSARVFSGFDGSLLYRLSGPPAVGGAIAGAGDVDGDGTGDIVVQGTDVAEIRSGIDGSRIIKFEARTNAGVFAKRVDGAGDVDGDGFDDVIVGRDGQAPNSGFVISGASGELLYTLDVGLTTQMGDVAGIGDANADGHADFALSHSDRVRVYSGATGAVMYDLNGPAAQIFGSAVAGVGDVDGDGSDDILVGAQAGRNAAGWPTGTAYVYSGRTGAIVYRFEGQGLFGAFGTSVAGGGDIDGDGIGDLLIGDNLAAYNGASSGSVFAYSGATGALLMRIDGNAASHYFGLDVAIVGDVTGDGLADIAVLAPYDNTHGAGFGCVTIFDLGFTASPGRAQAHVRGIACRGSAGRIPRIGSQGVPRLGATMRIELRGAPPIGQGTLQFGRTVSLPLGGFGLPGCTLYAQPIVAISQLTTPLGVSQYSLSVPANPALIGATLGAQWVTFDPDAPRALPFAFSDGLELSFGI